MEVDITRSDFQGWATVAGVKCSDGRVIGKHAFDTNDGTTVPLVWQHGHNEVTNVLGHAYLQRQDKGIYAYGFLNGTPQADHVRDMITHGDIDSLSIFANRLKQEGNLVHSGNIVEVSLVLAGANPEARIEDVSVSHSESGEYSAHIFCTDADAEHADKKDEDEEKTSDSKDEEKTSDSKDEEKTSDSKDEEKTSDSKDDEKTVADILDTFNDDQMMVLEYLLDEALKDNNQDQNPSEQENDMKHNIFESTGESAPENELKHSEIYTELAKLAQSHGTTLSSELAHADYGIENIGYLFPDAKLANEPSFINRDQSWVTEVVNAARHSPFARVKSVFADIRDDKARAMGYAKKGAKKIDEVFRLLTRTTNPTTIYKKQKLDRDDLVDITDLDVAAWVQKEMRIKLQEELARAILIGDGRTADNPGKIDEESIRPILRENDLFAIHKVIEKTVEDADLIDTIVMALAELEGTGAPTLFMAKTLYTKLLLLKDKDGRRLYSNAEELRSAFGNVAKIVTVPYFEGLQRDLGENKKGDVLAIAVNMADYTIGANAGGELGLATDFDIDFNQYKYLMETRCSGSLTVPYSALTVTRKVTA
nr:MAG TPA: major capsid protein [Caudoviricetes sp.]